MVYSKQNLAWEEYRLFLLPAQSTQPLALREGHCWRLPKVSIPRWTRPAEHLQRAIFEIWGLHVILLECRTTDSGSSSWAFAEILSRGVPNFMTTVEPDEIADEDLSRDEREAARSILSDIDSGRDGPFSRRFWIEEAIEWLRTAVPGADVQQDGILQYNAGGRFALLRLVTQDGAAYWLKATGPPNQHEFDVTLRLAKLCPEHLPRLIAVHSNWNAWIMEDAGQPLPDSPTRQVLEAATQSLAAMQVKTIHSTDCLLKVGASDQRLSVVVEHLDTIIEYLVEAMSRQTSTKVLPLAKERLQDLGHILRDAFYQMEALHVPPTLLHNDLNAGNVLCDGRRCVFIDWSEAAVGHPFLSFERLRRLSGDAGIPLRKIYRRSWLNMLSEQSIDDAFAFIPLLAIFACLYGRGDWLNDERPRSPHFEPHARSLARHLDREAHNLLLLKTLRRRVSSPTVSGRREEPSPSATLEEMNGTSSN
jgi:hypothetical protein